MKKILSIISVILFTGSLWTANAAPAEGTYWKETFSKLETVSDWKKSDSNVTGDSSVYAWTLNNFKHTGEKVDGELGIRVGYNKSCSNLIKFSSNQEGGIKDLYFKYRVANSSGGKAKFNVKFVSFSHTPSFTATADAYEYAMKPEQAQNGTLTISVQSGSESVIFGPISIVPYLLFTNKTPEVNVPAVTSFDLKTILIDNTGATPTFAVSSNTTGGQATITDGVIDLSDVTSSGTIKIKATWGNVSTTTTLSVTLPTPTITLENAEVALNGSYKPQPVVTVGGTEVSDPEISYASSNTSVATVDEEGKFTLLGSGTSTITATVAAKAGVYQQAKKDITLTVTAVAPAAGTFWKETFSSVGDKSAWQQSTNNNDYAFVGDSSVYAWKLNNFRNNVTVDEEKGIVLGWNKSYNNYIMFNGIQEGGIKGMYFKWIQNGGTVDYKIQILNGSSTLAERTITGGTGISEQAFNVAQNAQLKISMQKNSGTASFGPISIVPYLLFTNKTPEVDASAVDTFDLKKIWINNTTSENQITFAVTENTTDGAASIENGVIDLSDVTTSGSMKITATWGSVTTTTTLTVAAIPTPTIELENAEVAINGSYAPQPVVKIGETTVQDATITYTSSNASVATVDEFNNFTLLGTGTSIITATVAAKDKEYTEAQKAITLTVTAVAPEDGKFWKETFSKLANTDGYVYIEPTPVTGDSNVYAWSMRNYRHKNHDDDKVDGERGVRIAYKDANTNNYIEFKGNQEGGIKDLYFKWVQAGSKVNYKIEITGEGLSTVTRTITGGPYICAQKLNVAQNAKLKIYVTSSGDGIVFGPISVVPYLLFTNKTPKADVSVATSFDLNTILINNTTGDAPSFTVTENTTDGAASIENGVIDLSDVTTSGSMKITATWGSVTTTTTLAVAAIPTPTIELENAEVAINGSYVPQPVVKIGETVVENPTITYTSSNANVATVEGSTFTLLGTGTSTITATVAAKDKEYTEAQKVITLTVTAVAPAEGTFWKETFSKLACQDGYNTEWTEVAGDSGVYAWCARNYTHQSGTADKIGEEWGVRLGYEEKTNNYIEFNTAQQGGIKDLYFKWRLPGSGNQPAKYKIEIKGTGLSTITRTINTTVSAGIYGLYECAQKINVEQNVQLKLSVQNGSEPVIFGNILVVPYLLYTKKTDTLDLAKTTTSKNKALIDNRSNANAIEYSIVSGDATIDEDGTVTATTVGTVKVQAKWGDVTTTYNLKVINSNQFNLTWDANGGTLEGGTAAGPVLKGTPITAPTATKVGYNFAGWDPEVPEVMPDSNVTYKASWTPKKCNITLKSNYVGGAEDIKFVATYGQTSPVAGQADLFTRTGYTIKEGFWKNVESEASGERWVNKTGEYTKGVNGYTDNDRKWIHDAEEDITLYAHWTSTMPNITLNEGEDNSATIAANEGKQVNVTTDRKVTGGMFNTICLPFDVDAEQMATVFGADYQLVEFTSATLNEGKNELNLRFNTVEELQAGVPYLIKTSETKANITFSNVTIVNTIGESVGDDIKMYGVMSPTVLGASEKSHLIVVANDMLSWVTNGDTGELKGMRAYLKVENEQVQAAIRRSNPRLVLNGTDTTTDIMQNAECTMPGVRKLLINGQLYIECNGRLYNVLGY